MTRSPIMIRTFHAVGHGCFVTERFKSNNGDDDIKVVYDCGGKSKVIGREIKNALKENDSVDALFISHFDNDHVNGLPILLKRCKQIKHLIIPYLSEADKTVIALSCLANKIFTQSDINTYINVTLRLIMEPKSFFRNERTVITKILPMRFQDDDYAEQININGDEDDIVPSGKRVNINGLTFDWLYVPFYHFDSNNYSKIIKEIKNDPLINCYVKNNNCLDKDKFIEDINDKDKFKKIRKQLNQIFINNGGSNENSLVLYSGGNNNYFKSIFNLNNYYFYDSICNICKELDYVKRFIFREYYNFNLWKQYRFKIIESGCLYFGDYNCNAYLIQDKSFLDEYLKKSGIILLPHHGSINNFHDELLSEGYEYTYAVVCHEKYDQYGHPSSWVCEKLLLNDKKIINVTEESFSSAYFIIYHEI